MIYQIKVGGRVDSSWSDWFDEMDIFSETGHTAGTVTIFTGTVEDQATLRGILNHLWDLNLTILSVVHLETESEQI